MPAYLPAYLKGNSTNKRRGKVNPILTSCIITSCNIGEYLVGILFSFKYSRRKAADCKFISYNEL